MTPEEEKEFDEKIDTLKIERIGGIVDPNKWTVSYTDEQHANAVRKMLKSKEIKSFIDTHYIARSEVEKMIEDIRQDVKEISSIDISDNVAYQLVLSTLKQSNQSKQYKSMKKRKQYATHNTINNLSVEELLSVLKNLKKRINE